MSGGRKVGGLDEIGYWSEVKLDIIKQYAQAYSRILSAQNKPKLYHVYIDGFAGAGVHVSKTTGDYIPGSPLNALHVTPPFKKYYLVDLDGERIGGLRDAIGDRSDVVLQQGDCNKVLLDSVLPHVKRKQYRRGLMLLDPYGMHLDWEVMKTAGQMKTIDLFLNFPIMDINMNALRRKGGTVEGMERLTKFWGDESWKTIAYKPAKQPDLFAPDSEEKVSNEAVVAAFQERLEKVAGFPYVPAPMPMRNTSGAVVYYLFFASQKGVANNIVQDIFKKYQDRR